jgi:hypothetical protein
MKKIFYLLSFIAFSSYAQQSINDFKTTILPLKFDFQEENNQYRFNSSLKFELEKLGFKILTTPSIHEINIQSKCDYLYLDVKNLSNSLSTKVQLNFVDCNGNVLFQSEEAKSKEKAKEKAFKEVVKLLMFSIKDINYQYNGKEAHSSTSEVTSRNQNKFVPFDASQTLYAQKIENGFQLIDTTPKVVMNMTQTSRPDTFMAEDLINQRSGIVFKKDNLWIYEVVVEGKTLTYTLNIKF